MSGKQNCGPDGALTELPANAMSDEKSHVAFGGNRFGYRAPPDATVTPARPRLPDSAVTGRGEVLRPTATHCYVAFFGRNVVTESMSGFFGPEKQAAARDVSSERGADASLDASLTILRALAATGPISISELLPMIRARPRATMAILDDLERADQVRITQSEFDETVELTDSGRKQLAP
jgi:hypothetical protein